MPVSGDWNGDGAVEIGIVREDMWALDLNGNGRWDGIPEDRSTLFGEPGAAPLVGNWASR